jgi:hypothetical protein
MSKRACYIRGLSGQRVAGTAAPVNGSTSCFACPAGQTVSARPWALIGLGRRLTALSDDFRPGQSAADRAGPCAACAAGTYDHDVRPGLPPPPPRPSGPVLGRLNTHGLPTCAVERRRNTVRGVCRGELCPGRQHNLRRLLLRPRRHRRCSAPRFGPGAGYTHPRAAMARGKSLI